MRQWDYLHCPPGTAHITLGAGDGPCAILMVGTRDPDDTTHYLADPVAARHGAAVETPTDSAQEAYAGRPPATPAPAPWPPRRRARAARAAARRAVGSITDLGTSRDMVGRTARRARNRTEEHHVAAGDRSVPHHAGRHGLLGLEDAPVGGRARALHAARRRRDDRRRARRAARPAPARRPTTSSTRSSRSALLDARRRRRRRPLPQHAGDRASSSTKASPRYVGGILEMANARLYPFWGDLTEALRTGKPQNEIKHTGTAMFEELYSDPARLEQFMGAMTGHLAGQLRGASPRSSTSRATRRSATSAARPACSLDHRRAAPPAPALHHVRPAGRRADRASARSPPRARRPRHAPPSGDFFDDPLPKADVITMGMILHDWNLEKKMHLIRAAYDALPAGRRVRRRSRT